MKIAQLAVDRRFAGQGLGTWLIWYTAALVHELRHRVGCRILSLDAKPDTATWYERHGFERNVLEQIDRENRARSEGRDPARLGISMRFDLHEAKR
ncbi:MAG TPA: GNAT family N-acetyltransferase [Longimicrobium sp.]|nr:GNAT family N-acetyltransferase [Longimicrobium sp.]